MTEQLDNGIYPWTGHPASTSEVTYTADGLNRLVQANANAISYDANGNLASDSLTTYVYDVENRLVSASGQNTAWLRYDPFGRLHEVTDGQGNIQRFLYDGDALVGEYGPTGTMLARHVHGVGAFALPTIHSACAASQALVCSSSRTPLRPCGCPEAEPSAGPSPVGAASMAAPQAGEHR